MARWVPDELVSFDKPAADIAGMFADAERRLVEMVAVQLAAGLDAGESAATALRLGELADASRQMVAELRLAWPDEIDRLMALATESGATAALQELSGLAGVPDVTATTPIPGGLAAQLATADLTSALEAVTFRILRFPDDIYRRAVGQSVTDVLLGLGTNRSAQAHAWQKLISQGVTGFVDKANRRWNLATYVEMATRTAARRAWNDQHVATMTEHGIDLVSIVVGSDACQKCATWSGKVLRTDNGPVGPIEVQSVVSDAMVTVDVAGTLDEARAAGWSHPNCRCRPVAYLSGLSTVTDATTYDPEAEAARERLRDLERQVRKVKLDESAAVTPDGKSEARKKRLALQTKIREQVDTTGLIRRRYREQISLGRRIFPDGPAAP